MFTYESKPRWSSVAQKSLSPASLQRSPLARAASKSDGETESTSHELSSFDFSRISVLAPRVSSGPRSRSAPRPQPSLAKSDSYGESEGAKNAAPPQEAAPQQPASKEPAPAQPTPTAASNETATSGTIPDITTPPGQGRETGAEAEEAIAAADTPSPAGEGNVVTKIKVTSGGSSLQPRVDRPGGGKEDTVVSGIAMGAFSQPGGRPVGVFGSEFYEPAFTGIAFAFAGGKCTISANLDTVCPWGTNAGGRTYVPSAMSPVVTAANWSDIRDDLTPRKSSPHKSPRKNFYSQTLVERHEKFHGTDDLGWTTGSGLAIVKAHLEAGTVAPATAAADVHALIDGARAKLISENLKWYKGTGTSHDEYAGEIRAYANGRPLYQALADSVETRAKAAKWVSAFPNAISGAIALDAGGSGSYQFRARYGRLVAGTSGPLRVDLGAGLTYLSSGEKTTARLGGVADVGLRFEWPYVYVGASAGIGVSGRVGEPSGRDLVGPEASRLRVDILPGLEAGFRLGVINVGINGTLLVPLGEKNAEERKPRTFLGFGVSAEF